MPKNIEIKARLADFARTLELARQITGSKPEMIVQEDIFFHCSTGRLKLRVFADKSAELIAYQRDDQHGPKNSDYVITPVADADSMREALQRSLGERAIVRKRRRLFLSGRTRIHLDQVQGLGDFLELEVVMNPGEPAAQGVQEADELMAALEISPEALIEVAYVDLQEASTA